MIFIAGRVPKGLSIDRIIEFLRQLRTLGCMLVVDSNSFSMEELINLAPWLIEPNEQEIEALFGETVNTLEQARSAAAKIYGMAQII